MKKAIVLILCLVLISVLTSCDWFESKNTETTPVLTSEPSTGSTSISGQSTEQTAEQTTASNSESAEQSTLESATDATTTAAVTEPTTATTAGAPTTAATTSSPSLYTSYALMKTYSPATGEAQFDYFDMLRGAAAVQWLVDHEGKTEAEAQAIVDDYADSDFIMKNTNLRLRTINLTDLPLKLMYTPDGMVVEGAVPVDADVDDLNTLYSSHPDLVLDTFFYFVEVEDGAAILVEQVYWP